MLGPMLLATAILEQRIPHLLPFKLEMSYRVLHELLALNLTFPACLALCSCTSVRLPSAVDPSAS